MKKIVKEKNIYIYLKEQEEKSIDIKLEDRKKIVKFISGHNEIENVLSDIVKYKMQNK